LDFGPLNSFIVCTVLCRRLFTAVVLMCYTHILNTISI
jgi:hypothetical protein